MNIEFKDIAIAFLNELIDTCRQNSYCQGCPYYNVEKGDCKIQMESKAENTPDKW